MKRLVPAFFVIVAAVLIIIVLSRKTVRDSETSSLNEEVILNIEENSVYTDTESALGIEDSSLVSFMPLYSNETLVSSMGIDLDDDHLDDEILVVRKSGKPNLFLIVGLYNPQTTVYDRVAEIETAVTQARSFSYNGIDVTGDHRTSLVYQGFTDEGESVMQIYFCRRAGGSFSLQKIGDFRSDGTIFLQQFNRTDTYELSQSSGRSFPVWVYNSDTRPGASNLSQIQTEYDWSPAAGHYVQTREIYVTGKNLAAAELARIQDGTVKTFADYLNGLWYKTDNQTKELRYIFFDYENLEVNFLVNDTQEVYNWQDSTLYRNGIYLSTVNSSIENLRRRFNITLTDIDEMRVHVYDDVRMRIGADTLWDGQYKKMNIRKDFYVTVEEETPADRFVTRLGEAQQWYAPDGANITFRGHNYSVNSETVNENGVFFITQIGDNTVIQFNPQSQTQYLRNAYIINFGQTEIPPSGRRKTVTYEDNLNVLVMHPAEIRASECYEVNGRTITLTASAE